MTIRATLIPTMRELADVEVVGFAETVSDAVSVSANNDWQLMILDLFLRGGTGLTVLEQLRTRSPTQRIVVLSNYATPDIRERCARLGANAVFDKSTELDEFFVDCARVH